MAQNKDQKDQKDQVQEKNNTDLASKITTGVGSNLNKGFKGMKKIMSGLFSEKAEDISEGKRAIKIKTKNDQKMLVAMQGVVKMSKSQKIAADAGKAVARKVSSWWKILLGISLIFVPWKTVLPKLKDALFAIGDWLMAVDWEETFKTIGDIVEGTLKVIGVMWDIIEPLITGIRDLIFGKRELKEGSETEYKEKLQGGLFGENSSLFDKIIGGTALAGVVASLIAPIAMFNAAVWLFSKSATRFSGGVGVGGRGGTGFGGPRGGGASVPTGSQGPKLPKNLAHAEAMKSGGASKVPPKPGIFKKMTSKVKDSGLAKTLSKYPKIMKFAKVPGISHLLGLADLYSILSGEGSLKEKVSGVAGVLGGFGTSILGATAGATLGTLTGGPVGTFIGSIAGGTLGYLAGDSLATGLAQWLLGMKVDAFPDWVNKAINGGGDELKGSKSASTPKTPPKTTPPKATPIVTPTTKPTTTPKATPAVKTKQDKKPSMFSKIGSFFGLGSSGDKLKTSITGSTSTEGQGESGSIPDDGGTTNMGGVKWNKMSPEGRKGVESAIWSIYNKHGKKPTFVSGLRDKGHPLYNPNSSHAHGMGFDLRSKDLGDKKGAIAAELASTFNQKGWFMQEEVSGQANSTGTRATGDHFHIHKAAKGFHGWVNEATGFIAGEAGRERVDITPITNPQSRTNAMNNLHRENAEGKMTSNAAPVIVSSPTTTTVSNNTQPLVMSPTAKSPVPL